MLLHFEIFRGSAERTSPTAIGSRPIG